MTRPYTHQRVLDFCKAEVGSGKGWPHMGKIASHMGWKTVGPVRSILKSLAEHGDLMVSKDQRHFALADDKTTERKTA